MTTSTVLALKTTSGRRRRTTATFSKATEMRTLSSAQANEMARVAGTVTSQA
jgi:hypothetical protein